MAANGTRREVRALFDTGATINYLKRDIAERFPTRLRLAKPFSVGLGGRRHVLKEEVNVNVRIGDREMPSQNFHVIDLKKFDAVVGAFFMEQWGVVLDPRGKKLTIKRDAFELQEEF